MSVVESLAGYFKKKDDVEPCALTDLWAVLSTGDEAQLAITEITRERLCNRLSIRVRFLDGKEYEIDITTGRKWV